MLFCGPRQANPKTENQKAKSTKFCKNKNLGGHTLRGNKAL